MLKVYGAPCSEVEECLNVLNIEHIEFEYINILESTENLKDFLYIRKRCIELAEIENKNLIGIPMFVYSDGTVSTNFFLALIDKK